MSKNVPAKKDESSAGTKLSARELAKLTSEGIKHEGKHLVLPSEPAPGMTLDEAIEVLQEKKKQDNQVVNVHEIVEGNPFDALHAFHVILKREYGWSTVHPTPTFFGPKPPQFVDIKTGPNPEDVVQAPIGVISAPNMGVSFQVQFQRDGLHLFGQTKMAQAAIVKNLAAMIRVYLKDNSIYKGKAFKMPRSWEDQAEFLSFVHVNEDELTLSKTVENAVKVSLHTCIEHTQKVIEDLIPLKRTVVLSGPYGTGKSLTLAVTAKLALEHKWTVIYLDKTSEIAEAFNNAKRWQPCLLICEDIDRIADSRDNRANQIMNTLDGVLGKNSQVVTAMTTNHPERIERGMIRPGRIDAVIEVTPPDADAVQRLVRLYGRGKIVGNIESIGEKLQGQIPATIREVVERAKLARIAFGLEAINADALSAAIDSMGPQLELLNSKKVETQPPLDTLFRKIVRETTIKALEESLADGYEADDVLYQTASKLRKTANGLEAV